MPPSSLTSLKVSIFCGLPSSVTSKSFCVRSATGVAFVVGDDDVDANEIDAGAEGRRRRRLLLIRGWLLCRRLLLRRLLAALRLGRRGRGLLWLLTALRLGLRLLSVARDFQAKQQGGSGGDDGSHPTSHT